MEKTRVKFGSFMQREAEAGTVAKRERERERERESRAEQRPTLV